MSQYHQGPHFPVSSSPIFPLDAHPARSRRASAVSLDPRLSFRADLNDGGPTLPGGQLHEVSPPGSARSTPDDWAGEANPIGLDVPRFSVQHRRNSQASTGTPEPYAPSNPLPNTPVGWQGTPPSLNLVQYKPFPENPAGNGTSFFYRSPTPSARQRTNQACEKCRDRKTKCSGGRPTCVRCQARGLICEYASETRVRGPSKVRKRGVHPDGSVTVVTTRRSMGHHHPHAPRMSVDHPTQQLHPATAKAPQEVRGDPRANWIMSNHSEESNEPGGPISYTRGSYPGPNGTQVVSFTQGMPLNGSNGTHYPYYHPHTAQQHNISMRDKDFPILRTAASMPQLKPGIIQDNGEEELERSSSSVYSAASLDASFADFFSSSSESLRSRCPSSSSSPASNSHSSPGDQGILAAGISSTTIKLVSWPADVTQEKGQGHGLGESEDPVCRRKEDIPPGDIDNDTPRPTSHQFNASEWINGDDYSHHVSNYQFPTHAAPDSSVESRVVSPEALETKEA